MSAGRHGATSPQSPRTIQVRPVPKRQAWYIICSDGSRHLALEDFHNTSFESIFSICEPPSPEPQRGCHSNGGKRREEPKPFEPYNLQRVSLPIRHSWRWTPDGVPICAQREEIWSSDGYLTARNYVLEYELQDFQAPSAAKMARGLWSLCARMDKPSPMQRRLQHASNLPSEWASIAAIIPVLYPEDLQRLLLRTRLSTAAPNKNVTSVGNLMYYAARTGDSILCCHLIDRGLGSLVADVAYDGRTAYEIALEKGFPDTAYLLEAYADIRNVERRRALSLRLHDELEYVLQQDGGSPQRRRSRSLLSKIKDACGATFGSSSSLLARIFTRGLSGTYSSTGTGINHPNCVKLSVKFNEEIKQASDQGEDKECKILEHRPSKRKRRFKRRKTPDSQEHGESNVVMVTRLAPKDTKNCNCTAALF